MKILLCHNYYQQPGGEDQSFAEEARLLEAHGHDVIRFTMHNDSIRAMSRWEIAKRTVWNKDSYRQLRTLMQRERPAVMHCTNIFPLISPAAYYAAKKEGVAVVQSLRNYRLLCPGSYFMREGKVCEDCLGKLIPWPAVKHGCYRNSRAGSAVVGGMLTIHRLLRTWTRAVDRYFALTQFSRDKFVQGGLPADKIDIKPNFLFDDPGSGTGAGGYAVFVGRFSPEKGVETLLEAWSRLANPPLLKLVGDGPLGERVRQAAAENPNIQWCGQLGGKAVLQVVGEAACLVLPSLWYEGLPRTIIEAFSKGTPVLASRLGSMPELVDEQVTGHLVEPNAASWTAAVTKFFANPEHWPAMRNAAREQFLARFSANSNYQMLIEIYERALNTRSTPDKVLQNA